MTDEHIASLRAELTHRPYRLATDHSNSSHGIPVMVLDDGEGYARADILPTVPGPLDWVVTSATDLALSEERHIQTWLRANLIQQSDALPSVIPPILFAAATDPRECHNDPTMWVCHAAHLRAFRSGRAATQQDAEHLCDIELAWSQGYHSRDAE